MFYFLSSLVLLENIFTGTMTFSFHLAYLTWADRAWLMFAVLPIVPEMWFFVCLPLDMLALKLEPIVNVNMYLFIH